MKNSLIKLFNLNNLIKLIVTLVFALFVRFIFLFYKIDVINNIPLIENGILYSLVIFIIAASKQIINNIIENWDVYKNPFKLGQIINNSFDRKQTIGNVDKNYGKSSMALHMNSSQNIGGSSNEGGNTNLGTQGYIPTEVRNKTFYFIDGTWPQPLEDYISKLVWYKDGNIDLGDTALPVAKLAEQGAWSLKTYSLTEVLIDNRIRGLECKMDASDWISNVLERKCGGKTSTAVFGNMDLKSKEFLCHGFGILFGSFSNEKNIFHFDISPNMTIIELYNIAVDSKKTDEEFYNFLNQIRKDNERAYVAQGRTSYSFNEARADVERRGVLTGLYKHVFKTAFREYRNKSS